MSEASFEVLLMQTCCVPGSTASFCATTAWGLRRRGEACPQWDPDAADAAQENDTAVTRDQEPAREGGTEGARGVREPPSKGSRGMKGRTEGRDKAMLQTH